MGAQEWIDAIRSIQRIRNNDQGDALISLLLATPDEVFTDSSFHDQPLALTCFLDAGIRLYQQALPDSAEQAFAWISFVQAKLQLCVCTPNTSRRVRDWCLIRLTCLTVLLLELCQNQPETSWHQRSRELIEAHVRLMQQFEWKHDQEHTSQNWW
ncbi:hypothetical protein F2K62_003932 [Vibrio fluvialis]|nr:hypothetical protein [Vibrio fluvialis]